MISFLPFLEGMLAASFSSFVGAFSGGSSSLILLPILLTISPQGYIPLFTVTKVGAMLLTLTASHIHLKRNQLSRAMLIVLVVSAIIGTAIGTYVLQFKTNETLFKQLLSFTLIFTAIYLFTAKDLGLQNNRERPLTRNLLIFTFLFSLAVNILNGIFGGTGIFITIFFVAFFRMRFITAIAYSIIMYAVVNVFQTAYLMITTAFSPALAFAVAIGAITGSHLGTHAQYIKGNTWVKRGAITVMLLLGLRLFLTA